MSRRDRPRPRRAERAPAAGAPARAASRAPRRGPAVPPPLDPAVARAGRRAALTIAGAGLFWIAATAAGSALGWPTRTRALFDLIALAAFGWALYLTYQAWRIGRGTRG